mgnify:CR=1 FL=1
MLCQTINLAKQLFLPELDEMDHKNMRLLIDDIYN